MSTYEPENPGETRRSRPDLERTLCELQTRVGGFTGPRMAEKRLLIWGREFIWVYGIEMVDVRIALPQHEQRLLPLPERRRGPTPTRDNPASTRPVAP